MRQGFEDKTSLPGRERCGRGFALAASLAALSLTASAAPAVASVTLGQLEAGNPPPANCNNGPVDQVPVAVSSGPSYVVPPGGGVITSWSHNAADGSGQMFELKIFRNVSGSTFQVVAHDGPRPLTPGTLNTFSVQIPVSGGEIVGTNDTATANTSANACNYHVSQDPANSLFTQLGDLGDGASTSFSGHVDDERSNISAQLEPSNAFTFGSVTLNKKKGTATLNLTVPNSGDLSASGDGVKAAGAARISKAVTGPGAATLVIRAKGKKKRTLNETGKVKLKVAVTFTPNGGNANTQALKVKLKKRL